MVFGRDMDAWQRKGKVDFVEKKHSGAFLSAAEVKLLAIAGAGFFMDSYDLFIINMVVPILIKVYYPHNKTIPWGLNGGVLKAAANIGNVIGQIMFGLLGDSFGRQFVYGKECIIIIVALIVMICAPNSLGGKGITIWITVCRFVMGIGIGGDYPMSASVVADRANLKRRGSLLTLIFSAQGWGALVGAVLALIVIGGYYHQAYTEGHIHSLSGAWRILLGFGLIPAFAVLYFRLTMAESLRFKEARKLQDNPDLIYELKGTAKQPDVATANVADAIHERDVDNAGAEKSKDHNSTEDELEDEMIVKNTAFGFKPEGEKAHHEFLSYFSEWRHSKILIGTCMTWFLVDIAFYGINLNQAFILSAINFTAKQPYRSLLDTAIGNLIIIAAGYFPGYYFTAALIEVMGRNTIQIMGFAMTSVFLLIAGADFHNLRQKAAPFFIVFTLLQFFFNFGANSTTFVIPAEVFPSRIRGSAHGLSAAVGKCGAIVAALGFVELANRIGTGDVLLIFMAVSLAGIPFTFMIPETTGRDADLIDREELLAAAHARDGMIANEKVPQDPNAVGGQVAAGTV